MALFYDHATLIRFTWRQMMKKINYLLAVSAMLLASQGSAFASPSATNIPYANVGVINPLSYSFTALNTGTVNAYFSGSTAGYNEILGLAINGVNTNQWGLENKQTPIGTEMSWNVNAGDKLTFIDYIWGYNPVQYDSHGNPIGGIYTLASNITLNPDTNEHVYATPVGSATFNTVNNKGTIENLTNLTNQLPSAATNPTNGTPPIFVSFEDLTSPHGKTAGSDYNYNDLNYVYTNVGVKSYPTAPEVDANLAGLGLGLLSSVMLLLLERRRSR